MIRVLSRVLPILLVILISLQGSGAASVDGERLQETVKQFSSFGSRLSGTPGSEQAAVYISNILEHLGLTPSFHRYSLPVRIHHGSTLATKSGVLPLRPFYYNAITPEKTDGPMIAPVYYIGGGTPAEIDGRPLAGSILLMDFRQGSNYRTLASFGAKAIIFLGENHSVNRFDFLEKQELTPLQLPCFFISRDNAEDFFGPLVSSLTPVAATAQLNSDSRWQNQQSENIYALIEGSDPDLKKQLFILSAHYDTEEFVASRSPGADEASSIATFLELAERLTKSPPKRSVLLLATSGQAQNLAGLREALWSGKARSKTLRDMKRKFTTRAKEAEQANELLEQLHFPLQEDLKRDRQLAIILKPSIDYAVDTLSRKLTELRLASGNRDREEIREAAAKRFFYRRIGWSERYDNLEKAQQEVLQSLIPFAKQRNKRIIADAKSQLKTLKSTTRLRSILRDHEISFFLDLHLSSHGDGIAAFHQGWLYNLKPTVNRVAIYSPIAELLEQEKGLPIGRASYRNSLTPTHLKTWDSWFLDRPALGAEVANLAGIPGLSFVTTGDGRAGWGTPEDIPARVDWTYLTDQAMLVERLAMTLIDTERISSMQHPRD